MRGDVTVRAACLMPERLIQRATDQGARFKSIRRPDARTIIAECDAASARILLALCGRFSIPAKILGRRGASALARFARSRATLPVGIALAVLLSALFLGRVWRVDIAFTGEAAALGDRAALEEALSEAGVRPGMPREIDPALLAQSLQAKAGSYSYVGARLQGVRLLVEAAPEVPAPAVYDVDAARDLVAERDGIVVRAVARSGALCVAPGDAVRRGQTLIRGEEKSADGETRPIAALGEVIVRAWFTGEAALPAAAERFTDTGRRSTGAKLSLLGLDWPITRARRYASERVLREYLPVGGLFLPLEIAREQHIETRSEVLDADPEALKRRAAALALAEAAMKLTLQGPASCEIADSWVDYALSDGILRARAVYEIYADAAVTREALQQGG